MFQTLSQLLLNTLHHKQKWLLPIAVFLGLCAIAFRIESSNSIWLWNDIPIVAVTLLALTFFLFWAWVKIELHKNAALIDQIRKKAEERAHPASDKWNLLTQRERQIMECIGNGYSNKEICADLFIELSTLKTHINRIYKKLELTNRKEAFAFTRKIKSEQ